MIGLDEIISFITPSFLMSSSFLKFGDDLLQTVFFTLIFILFFATIITVLKNAKEESWEKKWYKKDSNKRFNVEYITVEEVNEAVETKSEKIAGSMPGILLTIGLLGTFVGLGIALDKASSILSGSNSIENADDQITHLMAMLDGLGAKFKTSTWGLSAFILLKFILSFIGYESKRLEWSTNKVKEGLDAVHDVKREEFSLREVEFSNQLKQLTEKITDAVLETKAENKKQLIEVSEITRELVSNIQSENLNQSKRFEINLEKAADNHLSMTTLFSSNFKELVQNYRAENTSLRSILEKGITLSAAQNEKNLKVMTNIAHQMESENKLLASRFDKHLAVNSEGFASLSKHINNAVHKTFELLNTQHKTNQSLQKEIVLQNKDVRDAMMQFIGKNKEVVNALSSSAKNMSGAAETMGQSATQLEIVISNLREDMEGVINLLKNDLSNSVTDMNTSFSQNMSDMTSSLNSTIDDMNASFKSNITRMSNDLEGATEDISTAVNALSSSVDKTMTEVTQTIEKSMELQTRAQSVFIESTDSLNNYVNEMTGLVNKLSGDIVSGLNAVSTSHRSVAALTKRVDDLFENLLAGIDKLSELSEIKGTFKDVVEALKLDLKVDLEPVLMSTKKQHDEILSVMTKVNEIVEKINNNLVEISLNTARQSTTV